MLDHNHLLSLLLKRNFPLIVTTLALAKLNTAIAYSLVVALRFVYLLPFGQSSTHAKYAVTLTSTALAKDN
jgi:hypothetical protein